VGDRVSREEIGEVDGTARDLAADREKSSDG
jgi:hypothetical protein